MTKGALPEICPHCGLGDSLIDDGKYYHCIDCGGAWPKPKPKPARKSQPKSKTKPKAGANSKPKTVPGVGSPEEG